IVVHMSESATVGAYCVCSVKFVRLLARSGAVHSSRFVSRCTVLGLFGRCYSGAFRTFPLDFLLADPLFFCARARGRARFVSTGRRFESCLGSSVGVPAPPSRLLRGGEERMKTVSAGNVGLSLIGVYALAQGLVLCPLR